MKISRALGLAVFLFASLGLAHAAQRWRGARGRVEAASDRLEITRAKALEVLELRGRRERVAAAERPKQDVIAQINAALIEAGVRSDALTGVEPLSDAVVGRPGGLEESYRRQSVAVTLERLSLPDLGRFLVEWRRRQPSWQPTQLELSHVRNQPAPGDLYNLKAVLTTLVVADELPVKRP